MTKGIIGLHRWLETPPGRHLLEWEQHQMDRVVADVFGYHALQLGMPELAALQANRMPHRWLAGNTLDSLKVKPLHAVASQAATGPQDGQEPLEISLLTDFAALPFESGSLDLLVLPHALDLSTDPHAALREVERVLVPEGRVVICGFNPASLWGLRERRARLLKRMGWGERFLPHSGEFIGYWRLRDWLRLLSFEVETGQFGCYRPAVRSEKWLHRFAWMDRLGARCWPIFGAVYFVVAIKRVRGMRLLEPAWKTATSRAKAPVTLTNRTRD
jgi:SAM-dependent methyltransferase